jgi:hypothetical protein
MLAKLASALALLGTVVTPVLFLVGRLELVALHGWLLGAALLWFASAPVWMTSGD